MNSIEQLAEDILKVIKTRTDSQFQCLNESNEELKRYLEDLEKRIDAIENETTEKAKERTDLADLLKSIDDEEPLLGGSGGPE